ncbi:hypothetical protein [Psychrobacter aquimaris]|uniref:hypothetical protein n=1 Tax=Psychrobacter aquimaris TaxID=292733 RepID=UPI0022342415|nr:hypothetical protein [Psychrobacter aquimaris]
MQVPQNNQLIGVRESGGDGNFAVALNESALYLGGAIRAGLGGMVLVLNLPVRTLPVGASIVAAIGAFLQFMCMRYERIYQRK